MQNRDGERRYGRYIKASNVKLIDSLALYKFSFEEICESPIAHRDNPLSNIIRAKLHDNEDIEDVVLNPEGMNRDLRDNDSRMPILQPVDFTNEWKRHRARNVGRPVRIDDEEELDMDLDAEAKEEAARAATATAASTAVSAAASVEATVADQSIVEAIRGQASTPEEVQRKHFQAQKKTIDAVSKAIQHINQVAETNDLTAAPVSDEASFIPLSRNETPSMVNQEAEAIKEYKHRTEQLQVDQKEVHNQYEAAKASGYQDGFKQGEEKATMQLQASVAPLLSNIAGVVGELELVKKTILDNVQQNFYEITQAIAETLIRREINVSPQTFATVVRQAIADAVPDDKITIAVHPDTYESLSKLDIPDLMSKITKDDHVKAGDFRIDSSLSVVDGNISKLIANLIEQADLQLFDKTEKAS